jgi:hypothetical protein
VKTGESLKQRALAISPNNRTLAFITESPATSANGSVSHRAQRVIRIEVDGTRYQELLTVVSPTGNIGDVLWTRDGAELFVEQSLNSERVFLRIPADGGVPRALAPGSAVSGSLSPDASRFMVVRENWTRQQLWVLENVPALLKAAR